MNQNQKVKVKRKRSKDPASNVRVAKRSKRRHKIRISRKKNKSSSVSSRSSRQTSSSAEAESLINSDDDADHDDNANDNDNQNVDAGNMEELEDNSHHMENVAVPAASQDGDIDINAEFQINDIDIEANIDSAAADDQLYQGINANASWFQAQSQYQSVSNVIDEHFSEYSDFVKNDCAYFTEYFNDLASVQTFWKRDEYSWVIQDFDTCNHGLSEYGNFVHVIQTFDASNAICRCLNYTRLQKCEHSLLVSIWSKYDELQLQLPKFWQEFNDTDFPTSNSSIVTLTRNVKKGHKSCVYSVKGEFERYAVVHVNTNGIIKCNAHRSKSCYHVNKIAKLYEEEEKKAQDSDNESDYDRAEDADIIDFNDPQDEQDINDQSNENNGDVEQEEKVDVAESRVHSHRLIPVPIYLRIKDEVKDPDNDAYDEYKFSKETIPKANSILRYVLSLTT